MKNHFFLILFAIAMVTTIYYNGMNVPIAKYISIVIYAFLFMMALIRGGSCGSKTPKIFKSWLGWLVLAGVVNVLMIPTWTRIESMLNFEIAMPLIVSYSAFYLFDIKREKLSYYMLPICAIAAFFAVTSVLSGLGAFVVDEYYEADLAKNQVGAAFTTMAIISLVFLLEVKSLVLKIVYGFFSIVCLYPAIFFACRTAFLSYIIVAAVLLFRYYRLKGLISLTLLVVAFALYAPDSLEAILYDSVVGSRDVTDIDDISSGRITHAAKSLDYFFRHPLLGFYGSGDSVSQMPPNAHIFLLYRLTKWGILGAIPFIALYFSVFRIMIRSFRAKDLLLFGTLLLAFLESFSEYSPPFGPGSCFIVVFILIGYFLRQEAKKV